MVGADDKHDVFDEANLVKIEIVDKAMMQESARDQQASRSSESVTDNSSQEPNNEDHEAAIRVFFGKVPYSEGVFRKHIANGVEAAAQRNFLKCANIYKQLRQKIIKVMSYYLSRAFFRYKVLGQNDEVLDDIKKCLENMDIYLLAYENLTLASELHCKTS